MNVVVTDQPTGTELTRFNALKHGILSRYAVLPWEDPSEYQDLLDALMAEHSPQGPTEEHLVEELAGILWRKRRLRMAEVAAHKRGLEASFAFYRETAKVAVTHSRSLAEGDGAAEAVRTTDEDAAEILADIDKDERMTLAALELLRTGGKNAYNSAVAALREDTRDWWQSSIGSWEPELDESEPYAADAEGLRRFLDAEVLPVYTSRRAEIANRPLIREQAFGESLDPDQLDKLARYEVHLDRKLERMLAMLLKLKGLRWDGGGD